MSNTEKTKKVSDEVMSSASKNHGQMKPGDIYLHVLILVGNRNRFCNSIRQIKNELLGKYLLEIDQKPSERRDLIPNIDILHFSGQIRCLIFPVVVRDITRSKESGSEICYWLTESNYCFVCVYFCIERPG